MPVFFDAHCHMMNLSHPNLTAMIKRTFKDTMPKWILILFDKVSTLNIVIKILVWLLLFLPLLIMIILLALVALIIMPFLIIPASRSAILGKIREKVANIMNLLAVMETDIGDCMIQLEEELRKTYDSKGGLTLNGGNGVKVYDKIVMTPLIMDFGLKNYQNSKSPYKVRWKPIVAQIEDLCLGIRDYYRHRADYIKPAGNPPPPLFEIHPFMGLNTRNYQLKSFPPSDGRPSFLEDLLDKNFSDFENDTTPEIRYRKLSERDWSEFNGNIESIGSHDFAGIKVYPPLGFNPWPEQEEYDNEEEWRQEWQKVCYLYDFCIKHNIPVTAHCSDGGFLVDKKYRNYSSPEKWAKVLGFAVKQGDREVEIYNQLRLNLGHFGGAGRDDWRDKVAELALSYDNVYTDISYQGVDEKIYGKLKQFLDHFSAAERKVLLDKIIFGSDFMINLQDIETYGKYLEYFANTEAFTLDEKHQLCHVNAMKYLYLA